MNEIMYKATSQGGIITTAEFPNQSDYQKIVRAKERGELIRVRHGVYAVPDALFNTMIDIERIVPNGIVCLYNAWAYHQLSTVVPPSFCVAIEAKRKVAMPPTLPIELYYWKKENLEFGVMDVEMSGYNIRMTDMER
ncbi:MAG: type IV toxin-antitoxin system AbiEi family antitoxin domain-containing protein, partial [Segatella copri]|nr:type IV toxin-antitoxin system AbiEi family antitoxin domain-containing protein [Segatella copri]